MSVDFRKEQDRAPWRIVKSCNRYMSWRGHAASAGTLHPVWATSSERNGFRDGSPPPTNAGTERHQPKAMRAPTTEPRVDTWVAHVRLGLGNRYGMSHDKALDLRGFGTWSTIDFILVPKLNPESRRSAFRKQATLRDGSRRKLWAGPSDFSIKQGYEAIVQYDIGGQSRMPC